MKITISGNLGSGKSTIAKELAKIGFNRYSTGDFMRKLAKDRGMTLLELSKIAENDKSVDKEIDDMTRNLRKEDNFVMDSRLAFYFIPESLKVFLKVTHEEAAKRIFNDIRPEEKENTSLEQTQKNITRRTESEKKRYKEYYGMDYTDEKHYDLVVDTNNKPVEEVLNEVLKKIKDS
ncbi:cytidylate kinase family protein [Candidatus Woesearchaeota archaeon]|nr:cytidylate kinase family protein [Candidatus Woesearchaeota archaeon]